MGHIDDYIEASGAVGEKALETREAFNLLVRSMPFIKGINTCEAADKIKKYIFDAGFQYGRNEFKADEVLLRRKGNCLGLPLLIGAMLKEKEIEVKFADIIGPRDAVYPEEQRYYGRLFSEIDFRSTPKLAEPVEDPIYTFASLGHVLLDVDGKLIETTGRDAEPPLEFQSRRLINFRQALSHVYKDRAVTKFNKGSYSGLKQLQKKGLELWPENACLIGDIALVALEEFDDLSAAQHISRYAALNRQDALYHDYMYLLTDSEEHYQRAITMNPTEAPVRLHKVVALNKMDFKERAIDLSILSHCYAESGVLGLDSFLLKSFSCLGELFDSEEVMDRLNYFRKNRTGEFWYHLACYIIGKNIRELAEAQEARSSPRQRLAFNQVAKRTKLFDIKDQTSLDKEFGDSVLYQNAKSDEVLAPAKVLNISTTYE